MTTTVETAIGASGLDGAGRYALGDRAVRRIGYGAMQLAGPGVWGPPRDRAEAVRVVREAVESGVDHIDTSDFYGPHVTNEIIREALFPYRDGLVIATKAGVKRGADRSWNDASSAAELRDAVHDNLRRLGLDVLEVVNFRVMRSVHGPAEGSIAEPFATLAELQREGLIRHLGLSNATRTQVEEARGIAPVACVQNLYNLAHREDDALVDFVATDGTAYVPFFPLGGFTPVQSATLSSVASELGHTPMQVALSWLLHRSPNILLIPGTSTLAHLRENLAAAAVRLPEEALERLGSLDGGRSAT